ncbi:MAG: hypothetical protein U0176_15965 [Bacteroidia bacterium]
MKTTFLEDSWESGWRRQLEQAEQELGILAGQCSELARRLMATELEYECQMALVNLLAELVEEAEEPP